MADRTNREPSPDRRGNLVSAFARAYPRRTAIALVCLVAAGVAEGLGVSVLVPLVGLAAERPGGDAPTALEQTVLGVLAELGLRPTLELLLVAVMLGMVLKAALVLLANRQVGYTVAAVATDLRLELIRSLLHTRWSYFVKQPLGGFANAVASEARRAADGYLHAATICALLIQSLAYAGVALFVSWQATLAALFGGSFVILALHWLVRASRRAGARQTRLSKSLLGRLTDVLQSIKSLKAMGRETLVGPLLETETERLNRALRKEVFSKEARQALQEPILFLFVAAALYGAVRFWTIPTSSVIVLVLLSARLVTGLGKVQKELQRMVTCESAYWSIRAMIDEASGMREVSHGDRTPVLERDIRFRDVGLAYEDRWVLRHASATIPAGELTVIVGASGAGKTTLADLVIGLLQPTEGEILIDGVAMRRIATDEWRRRIGYVPQETLLLHESIRLNVTLGDPELGDADVEEALRAADAWDFVAELPEGVDAVVGERGLRLSGGQRQRIALARALAHRPSLLILDEATAALDPATEAGISLTLGKLRGRVTLLAICHHGTLVTIADRLYAVRNGALEPLAVSQAPAVPTLGAAAPEEALRPASSAPAADRGDEERRG